eukprot:SAG31_NODE_433_length_15750_cov_6.132579_3_plen_301_part_00
MICFTQSSLIGDAADNYHDMTVAGLRDLHEHEYVSVWIYSNDDTEYTINGNSAGFHGCLLNTNVGFSATKGGSLHVSTAGWTEIASDGQNFAWSTSDYPSLFEIALPNTESTLDQASGRWTAPVDGIFFASAIIRLDSASDGWFSAAILTNSEQSWTSGMSTLSGGLASDYNDMTLAGLRQLSADDYLSVFVYSQSDADYSLYQNSAGFSVCALDTAVAFSAAKTVAQPITVSGWTEVTGYSTEGYTGLFSTGTSFSPMSGRFTAPSGGICESACQRFKTRLHTTDLRNICRSCCRGGSV